MKVNKNQQVEKYNQPIVNNNNNTRANDITSNNTSIFQYAENNGSNRQIDGSLSNGKALLKESASFKNIISSSNSQIDSCDFSSAEIYGGMNTSVLTSKNNSDVQNDNAINIINANAEKIETANQTFTEAAGTITANQESMGSLITEQGELADEIEGYAQQLEASASRSAAPATSVYSLQTAAEVSQQQKEGKTPNTSVNKQETEIIKTQMNASMTRMAANKDEQTKLAAENEEVTTKKDEASATMTAAVQANVNASNLAAYTSNDEAEKMRKQQMAEEDQAANDQRFADKMAGVEAVGGTVSTTGGVCVQVSEVLSAAAAGTGGCTFGISAAALEAVAVPLGTAGVYGEQGGSAVETTAAGVKWAKTGDAQAGLDFAKSAAGLIASVATASKQVESIQKAAGGETAEIAKGNIDKTLDATKADLEKGANEAIEKSAKAEAKAKRILDKQGIAENDMFNNITDKAGNTKKQVNMSAIKNAAEKKVDDKIAKKAIKAADRDIEIKRETNKILNKMQ